MQSMTIHRSTVPFSVLATVNLLVAVLLLGFTFVIESQIYRYFCLGAFASLLTAAVVQLLVTKCVIWPGRIALRTRDCPQAEG